MKIGFLSYPMLWQRTGGLQVQIHETLLALQHRGHDVRLVDILTERLAQYDLIHIFSVYNGDHRIATEARAQGVKTILSPLVHAETDRLAGLRYAASSWLTARLSRYELKTTYDDVRRGLDASDHILALSKGEKETLIQFYGQSAQKITIAPNGIDPHFFDATPALFQETYGLSSPFVLIVGSISTYKNQLGVIRATAAEKTPVVLIGPAEDKNYLRRCLEEGGTRVRHLGIIPHDAPLLASAYAAAGVTVLASAGESFGLTVVESLAAGTPAIITKANGLGLPPEPPLLTFVEPQDLSQLGQALSAALAGKPPAAACRHLVSGLTWDKVSETIEGAYRHAAS